MNAEFNMTNKHVGHWTLAHTEKAKAISPDQYGSHKHHKSINAILNKVLLNNILQQKKRAGAIGIVLMSLEFQDTLLRHFSKSYKKQITICKQDLEDQVMRMGMS